MKTSMDGPFPFLFQLKTFLMFIWAILSLLYLPIPANAQSPFYDFRNEPPKTTETETSSDQPDSPSNTVTATSNESESSSKPLKEPSKNNSVSTETSRKTNELSSESGETDPVETTQTSDHNMETEPARAPSPESSVPTEAADETTGSAGPRAFVYAQPGFDTAWIQSSLRRIESFDTFTVRSTSSDSLAGAISTTQDPVQGTFETTGSLWFPPWWTPYLAGILGVIALPGLIRMVRRRKVRVIRTSHQWPNHQMNRTRPGPPPSTSQHQSPGMTGKNSSETVGVGQSSNVSNHSSLSPEPGEIDWEEIGIDPSYRRLFDLRVREGKTVDEIAEVTGMGEGEIGLVFDLVKRVSRQ